MALRPDELLDNLPQDQGVEQGLKEVPEAAYTVLLVDLEPLRTWLISLYSGWGRPYWDPVAMLRTFLLMATCNVVSLKQWTEKLSNNPVLRALSGFEPDGKVPKPSTLYDYIARLLDGPPPEVKTVRRERPSKQKRKRCFLRDLKAEKESRERGKVKKSVETAQQALDQWAVQPKSRLLGSFAERMQVLLSFVVKETVSRGLIGTKRKVALSIDGSLIESQASRKGHKVQVAHDDYSPETRLYSDPDATLSKKRNDPWVFGYNLHAAVVKTGEVELPVALSVAPAHTADNMMAAMEIVSARAALEGVEITALLADAGYDASALYGFAQRLGMHPIIALRAPILVPKDVPRDEHGRPLCPGGCVMRCHGQQGSRVVFNCPIRRPNHKGEVVDHIDECPLGKLCEPGTKMGPYYRLEVSDSPKANLKIYPETERWKTLYKERTAVERLFSRLKTTGKLGSRPYRRMHVFHFVAVCQSMVMHLRAWAKQLGGLVKPKTVVELRALVARLREGAMRSA